MPSMFHLLRHLVLVLVGLVALPATGQFKVDPVTVKADAAAASAAPGSTFALAVLLDHAPGWHTHTNAPVIPKSWGDFQVFPTIVDPSAPAGSGLSFGANQWPKPHEIKLDLSGTGHREPYLVFEKSAVVYVPVHVAADAAPGPRTVKLAISYQACNDKTCDQPQDLELSVAFAVGSAAASSADPALFAGYDADAGAKSQAAKPAPSAVGTSTSSEFAEYTIVSVLLLAGLGGFILNLTPCVLPVIPIKILSLQHAAGASRSRHLVLGFVTAAGVIAFWEALGLMIVSFKVFTTTNQLFGNPYFLLGVGSFIAVMALGMFNVFVINLPSSLYSVQPRLDSVGGSFLFGVMTAILGTPCFGPFAGGAAAWAVTQPAYVSLSVFASLGFGMSLPFIVFALFPKLTGFIPRTGPASELVKQVMGLLMLGAGVYFLGTGLLSLVAEKPYLAGVLHWWAVSLFAFTAGLWLIHQTFKITPSPVRRGVFSLVGLGLIVPAFWWSAFQTADAEQAYAGRALWRDYTPEALTLAKAQRKAVVLDFTAEWCLNCKALEAAVLRRDDVKAALSASNVVAMKADLTSRTAPGWKKLEELGELGIPLLVVFDDQGTIVWKGNAYTPSTVLEQVTRATGGKVAAAEPATPR